MIRKRLASSLLTAGLLLAGVAGTATPAGAAVHARSYPNCKALNRVYPHGVGLPHARDKTRSGSPRVTNFTRSAKLYHLNDGTADHVRSRGEHDLDRDNDGIACEKR